MANTKTASIAHVLLGTLAAAVVVASTARPAAAQTLTIQPSTQPRWEFVVSSGRMIQTGAQRNAVQDGNMTAAQVWYVLSPSVAVTGTAGWARSRDISEAAGPKRDIFTYDLGAEVRTPRMPVYKAISVRPFGGGGFGGQTHNNRGMDMAAMHNMSVYGSAGIEVGFGRVGLRVEARDYMTGFNPLGTGTPGTRHNVAVLTGLRLGVR